MASAQKEQSRVLQEELTCPVCLDVYRDPHLLPCGHNFCKICLDHLKRQGERGRIRCPECRESHRNDTVFQKNLKLSNIADDYRHQRRAASAGPTALKHGAALLAAPLARSVNAVPCDYCPAVTNETSGAGPAGTAASVFQQDGQEGAAVPMFAVKTCLKCEVSMCQEHVKPHLELPAFCEHLLTEPVSDFGKRKCLDHDEIYRYYCMDDKVCVCNACTIEGQHSGHTMKTLKNTMKDLKVILDKQMYKVERRYSLAEKKLQEQKEKERQNKKFMDDSEESLNRLGEELKAKVLSFVTRLQKRARAHCDINGPAIQKNISRIGQDQARLQEVRCGIERLMQENDPFRFIEEYKTTGKQCRRQLRKNMFYPEYIDMETDVLLSLMELELSKFVDKELTCHVEAAIHSLCHRSDLEEVEVEEENEEEAPEDEDDDDDDDPDDSSEEEMRSDGEEEEEEEEDEEEGHDHSELADDLYSPGEEEEEVEEDDEEEEEVDEEEEEEERGV